MIKLILLSASLCGCCNAHKDEDVKSVKLKCELPDQYWRKCSDEYSVLQAEDSTGRIYLADFFLQRDGTWEFAHWDWMNSREGVSSHESINTDVLSAMKETQCIWPDGTKQRGTKTGNLSNTPKIKKRFHSFPHEQFLSVRPAPQAEKGTK